ncbi:MULTISPECIES: hypothetical protein [Akkermansia]|jgi:hypothetical protein|uniref:hypothetical protein n=1 Tax=Akkermansia TaxID=239934 RepID=UPI001BFF5F03|nr:MULTISPECIES: hypothetical protein [Akkermansia]MBT8770223.1 hypothetical protein [Akkermansia muciniphila]MBS7152540.1 hypothetical protein [Akkermansia sp.]MBT8794249.1 hypothetical protein [Akkermansia muciniphila]MBT9563380.1 hypothetical protein [Candidatus Akkermansia timonensis]MBT9565975.1 hypothetical protein [Akkermansia muciniphila]
MSWTRKGERCWKNPEALAPKNSAGSWKKTKSCWKKNCWTRMSWNCCWTWDQTQRNFPPCRAARRVAFFHLLVEVDQGQHGFSLLVGRRGVCQQVVVQIGLTFLVAYQGNAELLLGVLGRLVLVDDTAPVVSLVKMDLAVEGSERAGLRGQC